MYANYNSNFVENSSKVGEVGTAPKAILQYSNRPYKDAKGRYEWIFFLLLNLTLSVGLTNKFIALDGRKFTSCVKEYKIISALCSRGAI